MDVVVVGGHGQVGLRLLRLLRGRGDRARGVIRSAEEAADLERAGAEPVVADLERDDLAPGVAGADAVVFAAGSGAKSGVERKRTVDLGGAVKLIDAAKAQGVKRYVMISAIGVPDRAGSLQVRLSSLGIRLLSPEMRAYYAAKAEAEERLRASGLDFTIVRPGRLSDDPGRGTVSAASHAPSFGRISRDDVAATLLEALGAANTVGATFEVIAGDTPVAEAISRL